MLPTDSVPGRGPTRLPEPYTSSFSPSSWGLSKAPRIWRFASRPIHDRSRRPSLLRRGGVRTRRCPRCVDCGLVARIGAERDLLSSLLHSEPNMMLASGLRRLRRVDVVAARLAAVASPDDVGVPDRGRHPALRRLVSHCRRAAIASTRDAADRRPRPAVLPRRRGASPRSDLSSRRFWRRRPMRASSRHSGRSGRELLGCVEPWTRAGRLLRLRWRDPDQSPVRVKDILTRPYLWQVDNIRPATCGGRQSHHSDRDGDAVRSARSSVTGAR